MSPRIAVWYALGMKQLLILAAMAVGCMAADIDGAWAASAEGPNGQISREFHFKADGAKLTGKTVSSFTGESVIENGKIDGDTVSFTIKMKLQDNDVTVNYTGTVKSASELRLSAEFAGTDRKMDWNAKRK